MSLNIRPLMPSFAAEITGVDIRKALAPQDFSDIANAIYRYGVVVVRDQDINDEQQLAFTRLFGPVESSHAKGDYVTVRPDVIRVTNIDPVTDTIMPPQDKRMMYRDANAYWHSDSSFKKVPVTLSLLSGRETPPTGANTEFADMRMLWDELDVDTRALLESNQGEHNILYSKALVSADAPDQFFSEEEKKKNPPVHHPLVLQHPDTGRKAVYVGSHTSHIVGLPVEKGRAIIQKLVKQATEAGKTYSHVWKSKDLLIWDNRSMVHRATPFESQTQRRLLIRTMVAGTSNTH